MRERSTVEGLERGYSGTKKTIDRMHRLVQEGKLDPTVQRIATWIRLQVPRDVRGHGRATADAIFWWVKRHGIFKPDPFQIEQLTSLLASAKPIVDAKKSGAYRGPAIFTGDCDTYTVWVAALGGALGFQYAFETVKTDLSRPDEFSHVYTALRVDGDWYPLDPSTSSARPGWRPPVAPELLARWPEGPIEDVVGGSMSGLNGHGRRGLGDSDEAGYYPENEYGYGIPKQFGPDGAEGFIPTSDPANMQLLPPHDTAIPRADLEPGLKYIKASKGKNPSRRIVHLKGQPDDHGPPYYRNGNGARQPYVKVERQPYPPGSPWNKNLGRDVRKFWKSGPYVQEQEPGTPERQVKIVMEQPMALRRRHVTVVTRPERLPAGMGQGEDDWKSTLVVDIDAPAPAKETASAGSAVLDTVTKTIVDAAKVAGTVATAAITQKYATAVANATNKVAGTPVVSVKTERAPSSIFASPWFWVGTGLAVTAGTYVLMKSRSGGRRRR
ncbi:MAG: hypothetical protein ACRD1P_11580 [Thermoanaerobaculia bacterium]